MYKRQAFYSSDIQERTADGLICKRPAGNTYKIQDDAWALDFYYCLLYTSWR